MIAYCEFRRLVGGDLECFERVLGLPVSGWRQRLTNLPLIGSDAPRDLVDHFRIG